MTIKTAAPLVASTPSISVEDSNSLARHPNGHPNGKQHRNDLTAPLTTTEKRKKENRRRPLPKRALPTFPLEVGYREVYDPTTGRYSQTPLTLREVLYPQEEEIGIVVMTQGPIHDRWSRRLAETFAAYLADEDCLILHDVLINWGVPGVSARGPDVALIYAGQLPAEGEESYHVGRDGPLPDFVIEITSESTRSVDFDDKPFVYATVGIPEFLIIDKGTPLAESWGLRGYRLGDNPTYEVFSPDPEGRITFARIGLQFEVVGRETINVYDLATGERWLIPEEQKQHADAETARADAEAIARIMAEAQAEQERLARIAAEAQAEQERLARSEAQAQAEQHRLARSAAETQAEQDRLARSATEAQLVKAREQLRLLGINV